MSSGFKGQGLVSRVSGKEAELLPWRGEGGREGRHFGATLSWPGLVGGSAQPGAQTGASPLGTPRDSERWKADP